MKESYKGRPSQSPWPCVMRGVRPPAERSVHRGTTGRCMELRTHLSAVADLVLTRGKAIVMSNNTGESGVTPTEFETTGTVGHVSHGSRETPATSTSSMGVDRSEKARRHKADRPVAGESDRSRVPHKPANTGGVPRPVESREAQMSRPHLKSPPQSIS